MSAFSDLARRALRDNGYSMRAAARATGYDVGYLSRVLNGKQKPSPQLAEALDHLLGVDGALTELVSTLNTDDRARFAHCLAHPSRVDDDAVRALGDVLAAQRRLDDALGSAVLLGPTTVQLSTLETLVSESGKSGNADVGLRLRAVVAEWIRFAGWLHASLRKDQEAVRLFVKAEELADEANDPVTAALAISFRGYVARQRGNWPGVVRASIAARESPGAHYVQRTFDTLQAAQGHAGLAEAVARMEGVGQQRHHEDARRMLDTASSMIENMTGDKAAPPPSVYWYSPTFFRMNIGMVHFGLGDWSEAAENLGAGVAGLPPEHMNAEWTEEYKAALTRAKNAI
ncbi:helix-turn-helix transcriptional regulator [Streptomyces sp. HNM0663]|uniref:Helix-turn-helix transcriptional regulator n=1 Tax=Streptomyces chengmaiensis TaxID=3040919 RepID=A0ABT6HJF8_9ACTN|nr:helix-turn-helix transcriptional regulator [Streptomyces chengmaiensis]MDH2388730.1 helix-turn-helix transcriptional regulator [Streptomyces chengmaiensis]